MMYLRQYTIHYVSEMIHDVPETIHDTDESEMTQTMDVL